MELSIETSSQNVTWKVQDFFQLPSEVGYSLDSPKFLCTDDTYCLRLFPNGDKNKGTVSAIIRLVRLTSIHPERNISFKLGRKEKYGNGEIDIYWRIRSNEILMKRSYLEELKDDLVPDGTFTVVCSMCLREQSSAGSPQSEETQTSDAEEEKDGLPGQSVFLSTRWRSFKIELLVESPCQTVAWKVQDFLKLPSEIGYSLESPEFRIAGDRYCLRLYPNGDKNGDATHANLQLVRLTSTFPERTVLCKFGYRIFPKHALEFDMYTYPGTLNGEFGILPLSRSELEEEKDLYIKNGTLTVLCFLRLEQSGAGSPQFEALTSNTEKEQERLTSMAKLQTDYRRLLQKEAESDTLLVVRGKEFRAHRVVLRARSTVFDAMFSHEMAEKESGRIAIDDLDPEYFGEFLEYLYTGGIEAGFSDKNAFGLYAAADKYDVSTLKSENVAHMIRTLTVDSFCDVMTLALRHHEEELLQRAIQFFKQNLERIIVTAKWQQFVIDNGISANELFVKALVPRIQ